MGIYKALAICGALLVMQGCVSSSVQQGAAYGALAGVTAGAAVGYAISDEDLLGSAEAKGDETGDMALSSGETILSGALVGAVLGAIVGGMAGHKMENPNDAYLEAQAAVEAQQSEADMGDDELGLDDDELGLRDETVGPRVF